MNSARGSPGRLNPFARQQRAFPIQAAGKPSQPMIGSQDAMAGDEHGNWIRAARPQLRGQPSGSQLPELPRHNCGSGRVGCCARPATPGVETPCPRSNRAAAVVPALGLGARVPAHGSWWCATGECAAAAGLPQSQPLAASREKENPCRTGLAWSNARRICRRASGSARPSSAFRCPFS